MNIFKNLIIIIAGLAILIVMLLWMQGAFIPNRIEPGLNEANVMNIESIQTVTASYRTMEQTADAVGSIQSRSTTNFASKILASILTVNVRPGDAVKQGDLLITLDDRDLRSRMQQSRNALKAAQATYDKTARDRKRFESLLKTDDVTQNAFDESVSAEHIAQAKLQQAQEQVRETEVMLSYAKIYAPSGGTIIEKFCDPGDLASPGKALLMMYDPGNLRVEAAVREQLSGRLKIGQKIAVNLDVINKEMTGTVEEIVPSSDIASRSVMVKVAITREEGLFPGMFARIKIPLDPVKFLVIPQKSVRLVGQLELVSVMKDQRIVSRAVRTGRIWNGDIEILSGISDGDEIVINEGA